MAIPAAVIILWNIVIALDNIVNKFSNEPSSWGSTRMLSVARENTDINLLVRYREHISAVLGAYVGMFTKYSMRDYRPNNFNNVFNAYVKKYILTQKLFNGKSQADFEYARKLFEEMVLFVLHTRGLQIDQLGKCFTDVYNIAKGQFESVQPRTADVARHNMWNRILQLRM